MKFKWNFKAHCDATTLCILKYGIFLFQIKAPSTSKPQELVSFRSVLINTCRAEFKKDRIDDEFVDERTKEMDEASSEKKRLSEDLLLKQQKAKRQTLGNMRFIGELFKLGLLRDQVMHSCIGTLLKSKDEEKLECLCRLLTTIGKDLDTENPTAKKKLATTFAELEKIVKGRSVSSRVRFAIQDLIELRQNMWRPRRANNDPKTIEQIHKEARQEEQERQVRH